MKYLSSLQFSQILLGALLVWSLGRVLVFPGYSPTWYWLLLSGLLVMLSLNLFLCLTKRWWQIQHIQEKGTKIAYAGSILFHCGLIVILLAGIYFNLGKFKGLLFITEGQTKEDSYQNYIVLSQGILPPRDFGRTWITLKKVKTAFYNWDILSNLQAEIDLTYHDATKKPQSFSIEVNKPFQYQSRKAAIFQVGIAPLIDIYDFNNQLVWRGFVNLNLIGGKTDLFLWPLAADKVVVTGVLDANQQIQFHFTSENSGEAINLNIGGREEKFLGYLVQIPEYRYWLGLVVNNTNGTQGIKFGFILIFTGLLLRFHNLFGDVRRCY